MDTRKYAAGQYLKPADVEAEGTMCKRIVNVAEVDGKFGPKLDVWFDDSTRISLSGKTLGELHRAYGTDSDDWLDKHVELSVGEYLNRDGNTAKMILLAAVDPDIPLQDRPKLTASVEPAKPTPTPASRQ